MAVWKGEVYIKSSMKNDVLMASTGDYEKILKLVGQ
jgi:hypothetical protein